MTTTVDNTIGLIGADYATWALWEDATDNTSCVAADEIRRGMGFNETFTSVATIVTVAGTTTDATRYRVMRANTGASWRDNANVQTNAWKYNTSNGCALTSSGSNYTPPVVISEDNVHLHGLQLAGTGSGEPINLRALGCVIDFCIIEANGGMPLNGDASNVDALVRNSLLVQRGNNVCSATGTGALFVNVTMVCPDDKTDPAGAMKDTTYRGGTFKNCAFFGFTAVKDGSWGGCTFITCVTDVASPPTGCTGSISYSGAFQNINDATRDFRPKAGSGLLDVGTTDTTNAAIDAAGTSRPQGSAYDAGGWEFVSAGGGSVFNPYFYRMIGGVYV